MRADKSISRYVASHTSTFPDFSGRMERAPIRDASHLTFTALGLLVPDRRNLGSSQCQLDDAVDSCMVGMLIGSCHIFEML